MHRATLAAAAAAALLLPLAAPGAAAHTVDSVGGYRLEIGWMNEPVVSGETNGIEIYVSPLGPCPEGYNSIECAEEHGFAGGIAGLEDDLRLQLVYRGERITLPFAADHDVPGKYYAFVNPTVAGFYQANLLGDIQGTPVSLSMHPPKVDEREYIEFPEPADLTVRQIIDGHTALMEEVGSLRAELGEARQAPAGPEAYAGAALGAAGLAAAAAALVTSRRRA